MALVVKDRVKQTTTTTGTGTLTLNGTMDGFQTFAAALSDGDTTYYALLEPSTNEWEVGLGTWTEGSSLLARTTVLASSNSGSAVNLTAQAEVFITQPATKAAFFNADGDLELNRDPQTALQAATKEYVDTIAAAGLHYHDPVRVEKEGNLNATYNNGTAGVGATLTNAGTQAALVIDGVTMVVNDRVLVYEQSDATQNGVYTVTNVGSGSTNWVLTRSTDTDSYAPSDPNSFGKGDAFFVLEGAAGAGELYVMNTEGTITFGTTNITFTQVASTAVYSAGNGVTLTGTVFTADAGTGVTVDGSGINIGQAVETNSDVTFNSVTASLSGNVTGNVTGDVTGNADTATALETARNIGGVSFDGTASINLPGVNTTGNQNTTGNAATATAWATGRTISLTGDVTGSVTGVDGTGNASITTTIQPNSVALGTDTTGNYVATVTSGNYLTGGTTGEGSTPTLNVDATPTNTASKVVARDASGNFSAGTITGALSGNATTASSLATARNIAVTGAVTGNANFDGSGNISIATTATSDPTVTLTGAVTGSGTMTNLGNVSIATTATADPTLTLSGDASGSATFTNLGNATLSVTVANDSHTHSQLIAVDDRDMKPNTSGVGSGVKGIKAFFSSYGGMTGTADTDYQDVLVLDTYNDASGGNANAITLDKSSSAMRIWNAAQGATSWGTPQRVFADNYHPNADKWTTARTLSLSGDASGSVSWDGSANATLSVTVADDSHNHVWGNIDGASIGSLVGPRFTTTSGYIEFGPANTTWAHIYTDRPAFYFNKELNVLGNLVWNAGNDGSGSGLDADLWDGNQFSSYLNQAVLTSSSPTFNNTYIAGGIYHSGDTNTALIFDTDTIYLQAGGSNEITVNTTGVRLGDTGNGYFQPVSGDYGSIQIDGGAHGGWEGYSIGGRAVFMHDNSSDMGLYDDVNNHWAIRHTFNGTTELFYDAVSKLDTLSNGVSINGNLYTDGSNAEDYDALSGTSPTCNVDNAGAFSLTMTGNTTFTFSGADSGWSMGFILQLTGNGSTVTWPASVKWAGGAAPDAPASGETDILVFHTRDGGTNWYGVLSSDAAA
jgi:hypothetical protein